MEPIVEVLNVSKSFVQTRVRFRFQRLSEDIDNTTQTKIEMHRGLLFKKRVKTIDALNGINLEVNKGEILGLLGPNGAGKTTLAKIISTLVLPDSGKVFVKGHDVVKETRQARRSLGLVTGGERSLYWKLTPMQNLVFFAGLYGIPKSKAESKAIELLKLLEIYGKRNDLVQNLSTGQKMKVAFARALMHDPDLLILDEYNRGLDPNASKMLRDYIKNDLKGAGKAVIVMTHSMEVADDICDRLMLIDKGKIVVEGTPLQLKRSIPQNIYLEAELANHGDCRKLGELVPDIEFSTVDPRFFSTRLADSTKAVYEFMNTLNEHQIKIKTMNIRLPTLGDVFQHYTGNILSGQGDDDE